MMILVQIKVIQTIIVLLICEKNDDDIQKARVRPFSAEKSGTNPLALDTSTSTATGDAFIVHWSWSASILYTLTLPTSHMELSISPNAHSLGVVAPEFISTTLDWWSPKAEGWGNSSVINADLSYPNLVAAAKGLSPFFLRIGGSQADEIIYNIPQLNKDNVSSSDDLKIACTNHPQKCLTAERWDEVLNFANHSGARVVFTVAYVRHTRDDKGNNDQRDWDSNNAKQFLEYTANSRHAKLGTVFGFELGNEVRHKGKVSNVTRIVNA
jgi:hypothetical protein